MTTSNIIGTTVMSIDASDFIFASVHPADMNGYLVGSYGATHAQKTVMLLEGVEIEHAHNQG